MKVKSNNDIPDAYVPKDVCDAIDGVAGRWVNLALWIRVSEGDFDFETRAWLKAIASRVVHADKSTSKAKRRGDALMKAIGLSGVRGKHEHIREVVEATKEFKVSVEDTKAELESRPELTISETKKITLPYAIDAIRNPRHKK